MASGSLACSPFGAPTAPIPGTCANLLGNVGRNTVIGPGLATFDFSLVKNNYIKRISESFNVQFRAEFFNLLNKPNFAAPIDNSTFFDSNGNPVGGAGAINGSPTPVLWVALAEKAYVEANGAGIVGSNGHGMDFYDVLGGLSASPALAAITGKPAADSSPVNPTTVANAWKSGQLIVLGTGSPASSFILGAHEYAVVGYNPSSSMPFEVFNPWGTTSTRYAPGNPNIYGLFYANGAFLSQNFSSQSIGSGAAPARDTEIPNDLVIQPAEQSQSNGSGSQKGHVSVISTTISRDPTTLHFSGLRRTASGGLLPIGPIDLSGSPRPPGLVQQQHHQPHHRGSWSRPGQRDLVDRHPLNKMGALIIKSRTAYSGPKPGGDRRGDSN